MGTSKPTGAPVRADHPVDSDPDMDEALRRVRRLDPVSAAWRKTYRELSAVRPNVSGPVLGAEVEDELAGAA